MNNTITLGNLPAAAALEEALDLRRKIDALASEGSGDAQVAQGTEGSR